MCKVIELFPEENHGYEPIPYRPEIDESDYALWKARQEGQKVDVLPVDDYVWVTVYE